MARAAFRSWLTSTLLVLLTAASASAQVVGHSPAPPADVDDKEARDLFRLGKQAFDEGRFERALKYFKDSYDLSHRPALLSNIGSALDRLRRDREALESYQGYLAEVPDAPNRELIEERIRIIKAAMDKPEPDTSTIAVLPPTAAAAAMTPTAAAQTSAETQPAPTAATQPSQDHAPSSSGGLLSRWWFWAGCGAVAAAAVAVGVAASSGSNVAMDSPAVVGSATRVRQL
jgi:tetratricopeptide (TPR) repeat protein